MLLFKQVILWERKTDYNYMPTLSVRLQFSVHIYIDHREVSGQVHGIFTSGLPATTILVKNMYSMLLFPRSQSYTCYQTSVLHIHRISNSMLQRKPYQMPFGTSVYSFLTSNVFSAKMR